MTRKEQNDRFAAWICDHAGVLNKVARAYSFHPAEQQDLLQEMQVAVWHSVPGFRAGSKVSSYIYRIALNRAISWVRRESAYRRKLDLIESAPETAPGADTPDPRMELVYAEIRQLSKAERALILMQLDGFSYEEIGQALGLSTTNVGARLTRIRRKLATNLKDTSA